jgi:FlaA1/EpsC-like NDP-sugar epimerase
VRYGNVINSRGSLIPVLEGIAKDPSKEFFSLTDIRMTRFFMTLKDSVKLIENTLKYGESGDTYVPKNIKSCKIHDLIRYFSEKYGKPIKVIGLKPGEKLNECLVNITEIHRTIESEDAYIIKPCYMAIPEEQLVLKKEFTSCDSLRNIYDIFPDMKY